MGIEAKQQDTDCGTANRDEKRGDEEPAQAGIGREGGGARGEGEGGEGHEDDEAHGAVDDERGEAAGALGGGISQKIKNTRGIAADAAKEEGVIKLADPGDDVCPAKRQGQTLSAQEQAPTPSVQRVGNTGEEERGDGKGNGKLAADGRELRPINLVGEESEQTD